jgi:hypothetical protein
LQIISYKLEHGNYVNYDVKPYYASFLTRSSSSDVSQQEGINELLIKINEGFDDLYQDFKVIEDPLCHSEVACH